MSDIKGPGVYVIQAVEMPPWRIKIGVTTEIQQRFFSLHNQSASALKVLMFQPHAGRGFEQNLHRKFHRYRLHGEWFQMDNAAMTELGRHIGGKPVRVKKSEVPASARPTRTLGKCTACGKNVMTHDTYHSQPKPGRSNKTLFRHIDCTSLVRRGTLPSDTHQR